MIEQLFSLFTPLNVAIAVFWFLSAIIDYSEFCYIWQLKEYRFDKMRDYFSTEQGKRYFLRHPITVRMILALVAFFWPTNTHASLQFFILFVLVYDFIFNITRFQKHYIRKPNLTSKIVLIFGLSLLLEALLISTVMDWSYMIFFMALRFYLISFIILLFLFPTKIVKNIYIYLAKRKIEKQDNLIVIGITGSYGKTSVKEFLSHILSGKFSVIATPGNVNTEIGIARYILSTSFKGTHIFIVEMGAYKVGEIGLICDMVKPRIGILTAIIEQHLSLFGSIENIQQTKYELLRSLPKDGLAVVNSDNAYCREYLSELQCKVETYGLHEEYKPTCLITDAESTETGIRATSQFHGKQVIVELPIKGEHNLLNLAPCVLVAEFLGMTREERIKRYKTLKNTRSLIIRTNEAATFIDDSYNSNPVGFKAAIFYFTNFSSSKKRIVVTRGMDELGSKSIELHEKIGEEIAFLADELIVINRNNYSALKQGVGEKMNTSVRLIEDHDELLDYIKDQITKDCVILLENRIPPSVYQYILSHTKET